MSSNSQGRRNTAAWFLTKAQHDTEHMTRLWWSATPPKVADALAFSCTWAYCVSQQLLLLRQLFGWAVVHLSALQHPTTHISFLVYVFTLRLRSIRTVFLSTSVRLSVSISVRLSIVCILAKRKHLAKKVQLWLIGSRTRALQWAQDEQRTLPLTPKRGPQKLTFFHFPYKNWAFLAESLLKSFFVWKLSAAKL